MSDNLTDIPVATSPCAVTRRDAPLPKVKPLSFGSWDFEKEQKQRMIPGSKIVRASSSTNQNSTTIKVDPKGKPLAPVHVGSRRRAKFL